MWLLFSVSVTRLTGEHMYHLKTRQKICKPVFDVIGYCSIGRKILVCSSSGFIDIDGCDVMSEKRVINGIPVAKHRNCRHRCQRRTAGRLTTEIKDVTNLFYH